MQKPKVFISYSHDSDEHRHFVRGIANRLRDEGVDCLIDQYINGFPEEGWQRWMENQIEVADFVLLVCTETYLRRYRGQETEGGKGVNFEGVVISQHLYDAYYKNAKFIPVIPEQGDYAYVPVPLKPYSTYRLPDQYDDVYRVLTGQARYEQPVLGEIRQLGDKDKVFIDRLPTVSGGFFGREEELALLDAALKSPLSPLLQRGEPSIQGGENSICIIQFIAAGGTGKTKLLRHWLSQHDADIPNRIVWSFYSQGSAEDKQVSASPFFSDAFKELRADKTEFSSEEEKGDYLAGLLIRHRCLLVLDGLEPLQHVGKGMDGRLKDRAITRLLQKLAAQHTSLCIITTRIRVHDISDRPHVRSVELDNLQPADGVALLQSLGVKGAAAELDKAVREYGCHALALHLLGNALTTYLDGDIHKRDTLDELLDEYADSGRHAFKVMQAYQQWLQGTPELQLLYLLGLFDHPIETEVLEVLWQSQIPGLTTGIPRKAWLNAIRNLREKHRLLSTHEGRPDLLDCHPLIREYFGGQLQVQQPEGWRQAHERLYEYYKALPEKLYGKFFPDTLEEMQPLFSAVTHGCAAGLYQQTLSEVYWSRVYRDGRKYVIHKLGAFNDDLAAIANFFTSLWSTPKADLQEIWQGGVLNWVGFSLRSLGRVHEALEPMQAATRLFIEQKNWQQAALNSSNLSELQLLIGHIEEATQSGQRSLIYADQCDDIFEQIADRTTLAEALHQAGQDEAALVIFQEAEQLHQKRQSLYPFLNSLRGFRYCDLLLDQSRTVEVLERHKQWIIWQQESDSLLQRSLEHLILGRTYLQQEDFLHAAPWLDQAVANLRMAGHQWVLPRGLLARAALHRATGNFARARQDLQEVFDIAEPSGMRLHLTDYHLEMARLLLAEKNPPRSPFFKGGDHSTDTPETDQRVLPFEKGETEGISSAQAELSFADHVNAAAKLIEETGYHRRDKELAELQEKLAGYKRS